MSNSIQLYHDDCFNVLPNISDKSIDMILCDLPYETSACKWDIALPLQDYIEISNKKKIKQYSKNDFLLYCYQKQGMSYQTANQYFEEHKKQGLWSHYERIIKDTGAIVLFASEPFTSKLISSNLSLYKYLWIWEKDNATNFLNKRYQPGKITEDICVFGKAATSYSTKENMVYYPQLSEGKPYKLTNCEERKTNAVIRGRCSNLYSENHGTRLPNNILKFHRDKEKLHPTQKPVALLEYLIKTYSIEGDSILDNCMGSGSTGVACIQTKRNFIGIELNDTYYEIAKQRIEKN